ncbi:lysoplasmalogenase [Mycobacterium sp.]|uniref:lysoplasmalogenase n=1 Tax=Mycobacterium sp. TaxID=1785 RepID=UPI003F7F8266
MDVPYAPRLMAGAWVVAGWVALAYGIYLTVLALRSPPGIELTGHWVLQPAFKASMAFLLTLAAAGHAYVRERRWLMLALLLSAIGDWVLALPWWTLSFEVGLAAFLLAHLCFVAALLPLVPAFSGSSHEARPSTARIVAAILMCAVSIALLVWFWPHLGADKLTIPVTVYILVLTAMVCTALLATLPTIWTAMGAVCFAASDSMIAIGRFILGNEALAVPIWWSYAAAQILITAGFFFGRELPAHAAGDAPGDTPAPAES